MPGEKEVILTKWFLTVIGSLDLTTSLHSALRTTHVIVAEANSFTKKMITKTTVCQLDLMDISRMITGHGVLIKSVIYQQTVFKVNMQVLFVLFIIYILLS